MNFHPPPRMDDATFKQKLAEARVRVGQMDAMDGFKDRGRFTILEALHAGICDPDCDALFDAYVMLESPDALAK